MRQGSLECEHELCIASVGREGSRGGRDRLSDKRIRTKSRDLRMAVASTQRRLPALLQAPTLESIVSGLSHIPRELSTGRCGLWASLAAFKSGIRINAPPNIAAVPQVNTAAVVTMVIA